MLPSLDDETTVDEPKEVDNKDEAKPSDFEEEAKESTTITDDNPHLMEYRGVYWKDFFKW